MKAALQDDVSKVRGFTESIAAEIELRFCLKTISALPIPRTLSRTSKAPAHRQKLLHQEPHLNRQESTKLHGQSQCTFCWRLRLVLGWQQTCEKAYTCGLSSILALFPAPSPVRQRNAFADIGLAIRDQALAVQYGRCINTSVTLLWLGVAHQAECPCRELLASSPAHPDGTLPVNRCN